MENEQAVVEQTDDQSVTETEESNAQDLELNNLLEEYSDTGETEESPSQETKKEDNSEVNELLSMMKQERAESAAIKAETEMKSTVKSIKGEMDIKNEFVSAFLDMKAKEDSRLAQAYLNKDKNPSSWAKIEKSLRVDLQKFIGNLSDKGLSETREAVASSVLNSKSTSPTSDSHKKMSEMSDVEFEQHKTEVFKKAGRAAL